MSPPRPTPKKRSIVYIDGFNLYYGAIRGGPHKWLDLEKFFSLIRQDDDIQKIKYFTALVNGASRTDQQMYLRALETRPLISVILGRFKTKQIKCALMPPCGILGPRTFASQEEKRTDVNIAIHIRRPLRRAATIRRREPTRFHSDEWPG